MKYIKYLLFVFILAAVAGCAEKGSPSIVKGECVLPVDSGSWLIKYNEEQGTCGELPDSLVNYSLDIPQSPIFNASDCDIDQDLDIYSCSIFTNITCFVDGFYIVGSSYVEQSNYSYLDGYIDITIYYNGSIACTSFYSTTYDKLSN